MVPKIQPAENVLKKQVKYSYIHLKKICYMHLTKIYFTSYTVYQDSVKIIRSQYGRLQKAIIKKLKHVLGSFETPNIFLYRYNTLVSSPFF